MSSLETFFVTKIYRAELDDPRHTALNGELEAASLSIAEDDEAGSAGARRTAIQATRPMRPSTTCPGGCRHSGNCSSC